MHERNGHPDRQTPRDGIDRACACVARQKIMPAVVMRVMCSDLRPLHLLQYLVPDRNDLPPGVEIAYDPLTGVHAFRFVASSVPSLTPDRFSFLAVRLLSRRGGDHVTGTGNSCHYFPEEFSLLLTFKMSSKRKLKKAEVAQCLFAISRRGISLLLLSCKR